jgi:hypothetical protein
MLLSRSFNENCNIFDVVLQCYFSFDLLPKFIEDNSIKDVNLVTFAGQSFIYDTDFIFDEFLSTETAKEGYVFSTGYLRETDPPRSRTLYLRTETGSILKAENNKNFTV